MSVSRPPSPVPTRQGRVAGLDKVVNLYALPPDTQVMDLIRRYFNDTGYLFPYIHEETFLQTYIEFRGQAQPKVRRTWLGLLNMVLAIATKVTVDSRVDAERRSEESNIFYQRALGLCQKQIMRGTSLEVGEHPFLWLPMLPCPNTPRQSLLKAITLSAIPPCDGAISPRNAKVR